MKQQVLLRSFAMHEGRMTKMFHVTRTKRVAVLQGTAQGLWRSAPKGTAWSASRPARRSIDTEQRTYPSRSKSSPRDYPTPPCCSRRRRRPSGTERTTSRAKSPSSCRTSRIAGPWTPSSLRPDATGGDAESSPVLVSWACRSGRGSLSHRRSGRRSGERSSGRWRSCGRRSSSWPIKWPWSLRWAEFVFASHHCIFLPTSDCENNDN